MAGDPDAHFVRTESKPQRGVGVRTNLERLGASMYIQGVTDDCRDTSPAIAGLHKVWAGSFAACFRATGW